MDEILVQNMYSNTVDLEDQPGHKAESTVAAHTYLVQGIYVQQQ